MPATPPRPAPTRRRVLLALAALALLCVAAAALLATRTAAAAPAPSVRLSDVAALVDDGVVEQAAFDVDGRTVRLHVADAGRAAAMAAATDLAADEERPAPRAPAAGEDLVVAAALPASYAEPLTGQLLAADVAVGAVAPPEPTPVRDVLVDLVPVLLVLGVLVWFVRTQGGGIGRLAGGRGEPADVPATRFTDVAGVDEAVDDVADVVAHLRDPSVAAALGARPPRGVLLEGPPGTGKTLLARAVAGEAGVPFYPLAGSDFVETFVGVGARRVRDVFARARRDGSAVVFIDEIDAIGRQRSPRATHGTDEAERTLNALLVEMDGFDGDGGILVLAATNRGDMLDDALTRPGRFDRRITVAAPDRGGRSRILRIHTRDTRLDDGVDLDGLARRTPGMTGAELENLVNHAAMAAARQGATAVGPAHLEEALQTLALGRARTSALVTDRDREVTAWHEAGHTLAALAQDEADDPVTVTIVPRGPAGGVTWMAGSDRQFMTAREAHARLVVKLAGRAAEEVLLDGDFTQGAGGDLQAATDLALQMVTQYGMGGTLAVHSGERYRAGGSSAALDAAVEGLLQAALDTARALVAAHDATLRRLVALLLEDETVEEPALLALRPTQVAAGPRPTPADGHLAA